MNATRASAGKAGDEKRSAPAVQQNPTSLAAVDQIERIRALQRAAGNRATVALLHGLSRPATSRPTRRRGSGDLAIQRMTLTDARVKPADPNSRALSDEWGLRVMTAGPTGAPVTRPVVDQPTGGGGSGNPAARIYVDTVAIPAQDSKAAALKAAAVRAGDVGNRMLTWASDNWNDIKAPDEGAYRPNRIFKPPAQGDRKLDPWMHKIEAPYKVDNTPQSVTLEFQHTAGFDGYITKVSDTGNAAFSALRPGRPRAGSVGAAMYSGAGSASAPRIADVDYSNQHEPIEPGQALLDKTGTAGKVAADAYTKLAGEGARFVCVRDNIPQLRHETRFYFTHNGNVIGVDFATLWVNWAFKFGRKYNISNADVRRVVANSSSLQADFTARPPDDTKGDVNISA